MPSVVAFPALTANTSECVIITNTKQFISPLSGYTQTASRVGARWAIRMRFTNLQGTNLRTLQGYLDFMEGQVNRIEVGDHSYTGAAGALGGTPLVNGASQTGTSLITDGWTPSTAILKAGDQISFSNGTYNELKRVTADVSSDGSGNATISIFPEIHGSPADGAAIETSSPVGTFMLAESPRWSNRPGAASGSASPFADVSISLIEDIGT